MELLGDMGNDRIERQSGGRDPCEAQEIIAHQHIGLADERIAEGDVHAERTAVDRPGEPTFRSVAKALVPHRLGPNLRMIRIRLDLEKHVVTEVETPGGLESLQNVVGRAHHPQIDVLGRPGPAEPELENESTLEHDRVSGDSRDASEEPIEDEQLATPREIDAGS
jgi:hypothetical protein